MKHLLFAAALLLAAAGWAAEGAPAPAAPGAGAETAAKEAPGAKADPETLAEWKPPLAKVREQLDLVDAFAQTTRFGGMTVKVPGDLQRVPLELIEGTEELRKRDIELYVKELRFKDLQVTRDPRAKWVGDGSRPALPALLDFATLGLSIEAKTRAGVIPLGATFTDGKLPLDFLLKPEGYDIGVIPDRRKADAKMDNVKLEVGGPLTSGIANTFFKKTVANLVMKYGVGQTLKLGEKDLLSGGTAATLLNLKTGSAEEKAVSGVLDRLLKK